MTANMVSPTPIMMNILMKKRNVFPVSCVKRPRAASPIRIKTKMENLFRAMPKPSSTYLNYKHPDDYPTI